MESEIMELNTEISKGGHGLLLSFPLCIPAHAYANLPTQTHHGIQLLIPIMRETKSNGELTM